MGACLARTKTWVWAQHHKTGHGEGWKDGHVKPGTALVEGTSAVLYPCQMTHNLLELQLQEEPVPLAFMGTCTHLCTHTVKQTET